MLVLIQNGVGAGVLTPIISILIILGSISTAVNMISGIVTRCVNAVERGRKRDAERMKGHLARNAVFTSYLHLYRVRHHAVRSDGRGRRRLSSAMRRSSRCLSWFVLHALITRGREI